MALTISRRGYLAGRPPGRGGGTCGAMSRHWRSVRSVGYGVRVIPRRLPKRAYWTSSQVVFRYAFLSIWCFFAAALSLHICYIVLRLPHPDRREALLPGAAPA